MAKLKVPGQNIDVEVPDVGAPFRVSGQPYAYKIVGSELQTVNAADIGAAYNNLPSYHPGYLTDQMNALGLKQTQGTANADFLEVDTSEAGEVFTQTPRRDNPNSAMVTSDKAGVIVSGVALPAGGNPNVPPTAAQSGNIVPAGTGAPGTGTPAGAPPISIAPGSISTHTVKEGDTLSEIAQRYGVTTDQITGYRSGNKNLIFVGEVLNINKQPVVSAPGGAPTAPPGAPTSPTAPPISQTGITPSGGSFDDLFAQSGLSTKNNIEDVIKSISKLYGFDAINKEMEELDNSHIDDVANVNDNPWLSEALRSRKIAQAQDKYNQRKDALVNRLRLSQDVVGKAIDLYQNEKEFEKDILFKGMDIRQKELDREQQETKYGTGIIGEYQFYSEQERAGGRMPLSFNEYQTFDANRKAKAAAMGLAPAQLQTAIDRVSDDYRQDPIVKQYTTAGPGWSFLSSIDPNTTNPSDDIGAIYAFAKIMDPESVVREGEYATVQKYAQSWAEQFGFTAARIFSNTKFLTTQALKNMQATAGAKFRALETAHAGAKKTYEARFSDLRAGKIAGGLPEYGTFGKSTDEPIDDSDTDLQFTIQQNLGENRENLIKRLIGVFPEFSLDEIAAQVYSLIPDKR